MNKVRQILLLLDRGFSERAISREIKVSRVTVRRYRDAFGGTGLEYESLLNLNDPELDSVANRKPRAEEPLDPKRSRFVAQAGYFLTELTRIGVTRQLLWEEYREEDPEGYGYSRFCDLLAEVAQVKNATMRFEHRPAELVEIDFAGKPLHYLGSGELVPCPVLVTALPFSGYGYVEALPDARLIHLVQALNNCLDYFDGVPLMAKSDNMKQWVVKSCKYEPSFPEALEQWANHNRIALMAARPYKPKDKPSAENHVHIAYLRIYATLRNQTFTGLAELNAGIREKLDLHHGKNFQKKALSRKEVFLSQEKPLLSPLPKSPFLIRHYASAKVQKNYHILLGEDKHYYSIPYRLIGKQVNVTYCTDHVEVFLDLERVALHRRSYKKNGFTTDLAHMPEAHRAVYRQAGWDSDYYLARGGEYGPSAREFFQKLMDAKPVIHQAYQSLVGLVRLGKLYGGKRLEAACRRALGGHVYSYTTIAKILENNMDLEEGPQSPEDYRLPENPNTRGPKTYEKQLKS